MGGLNASQENNEMIAKQIRTLENRLDKVNFTDEATYHESLLLLAKQKIPIGLFIAKYLFIRSGLEPFSAIFNPT